MSELHEECERLEAALAGATKLLDHYRDEAATMSKAAYENARTALECADQRDVARRALERAQGCIKGLLARTPVRDVPETLAEIDAALKFECQREGTTEK